MATYTDIPFIDLEKIATDYGLKIINASPIAGGNANSNYHVQTDDSDYVVTLAEKKSLAEVQKLADLLEWFKQHDFITSRVHPSKLGETVTQYKGKPILVKKWVTGTVYENLSAEMLLQIGHSIAKLHQIPAPNLLPKFHPYGLQVFATVINKGIDNDYESWLAEQIKFITKNLPKNLPKGLIHGDIFFDNVLFEGDKIKAIIDFEEACHYDLVFDIGMAILGLCQIDGKIDLPKANALIKGYEQIRPLLALEKKSLPLFIEYAATATAWWRFWKYNIDSPNPDSNKKHWEMVQIAQDINRLNTNLIFLSV
jgi:homoserine kinase type II